MHLKCSLKFEMYHRIYMNTIPGHRLLININDDVFNVFTSGNLVNLYFYL